MKMTREELLSKGDHIIQLINEDKNSFILRHDPATSSYHLLYKFGHKPVITVESVVIKHLEIHQRLVRSKKRFDIFVSPAHPDASIVN